MFFKTQNVGGKTNMNTVANSINKGVIQGIVASEVFSPTDNVSLLTLKVKDSRINPNTKKKSTYFVQFSAFDDLAALLRCQCKKGQVVYLEYYLSTGKKTDKSGITKFYKNRVITNIIIGDEVGNRNNTVVPYINEGILQGEFVSLKKTPKVENVAFLTLRVSTVIEDKEWLFYPQLTVYGPMIHTLETNYHLGDSVCLGYKIETEVKMEEDSQKHFFLDYVVTRIF